MLRFIRTTALWILLAPFAFQFVGAASNQLVLVANHDSFPVMLNAAKTKMMEDRSVTVGGVTYLDSVHVLMTPSTHLNFLADVFDVGNVYSVGDGLLILGEWLMTFCPFVWAAVLIGRVLRQP